MIKSDAGGEPAKERLSWKMDDVSPGVSEKGIPEKSPNAFLWEKAMYSFQLQ